MSPERRVDHTIVVGGGSAGCVVAARLAEAGHPTVLIEAGPAGLGEGSPAPGLVDPEHDPGRYWPPVTVTGDSTGATTQSSFRYWMGRALGGGSAVNGMLIMPGDRADYDRWAASCGCDDWSADAMQPWLAKAISVLAPEPRPAASGTVELVGGFDEVFRQDGLEVVGTTLDGDRSGLLTPVLATGNGSRRSVADAYLPAADSNLTVRTDRTVARLVVDDESVGGVVLADGEVIPASTVVLTAGTVGTARLLHRTGVVRHVGTWIKNHAAAAVPFPWPDDRVPDRPPQVHRVARWRSGAAGSSSAAEPGPDLTAILMGPFPGPEIPTGVVLVMASTVRSAGRLELAGDRPALRSKRLTNPEDVTVLRSGTRRVVTVCEHLAALAAGGRSDALRRSLADLARFGDRELDDWLHRNPGPVYHAVGSCRMGQASAGGITAAESGRAGTLHDLAGVVVADASIFPDLVAGGLQLPVMAVAERIVAETLLGGEFGTGGGRR